ncbi:hypothetical protein Tco_0624890 [Tanacetum coccineum]|uniref:Uncharacterized protein n=1 Tax=Tanacetum coccineum TaxID=301880 RepID=A0ABQ4WF76_9ASTR
MVFGQNTYPSTIHQLTSPFSTIPLTPITLQLENSSSVTPSMAEIVYGRATQRVRFALGHYYFLSPQRNDTAQLFIGVVWTQLDRLKFNLLFCVGRATVRFCRRIDVSFVSSSWFTYGNGNHSDFVFQLPGGVLDCFLAVKTGSISAGFERMVKGPSMFCHFAARVSHARSASVLENPIILEVGVQTMRTSLASSVILVCRDMSHLEESKVEIIKKTETMHINEKMSMGNGKRLCKNQGPKSYEWSKVRVVMCIESAVKSGAGNERILLATILTQFCWAGKKALTLYNYGRCEDQIGPGVDNRRITLIVIRARANSAVVVSLMEFVLVVLMEMEIKSIFQLRTLLINLQFIYPEPDYSLDFNSPQDLHNLQQQNLCCENCRGPHATIECQPMSQNSHSFGFDQLQTPQFSVNHQPPQPMSMEALQAQEDLMKSIESFLKKFNRISFGKTPKVLLQAWDNFFEVKHAQSEEVQELLSKLVQDVKIISDELSEYINTPAWNRPLVYCDNDDDEDYTIAITPESPTKEPVNSLSLGDEHLDTIPATESDEFIKSSVENLVPTPIEFEDFSDDECDLPPYDDSSKNHDFTFSNPLFDIDEDFTLSDESFSEEDIPKENFIIFSNPLFDLDEEIASTKVDRINDEVLEGIHSIPPGIDSFDAESDLVESVLNRDISIDSSPKIDSLSNEFAGELILPKSIPPEIEEVEFDPEGDILFLESLLYDNSSPRPPEALQANSNAIESLPPSHIPVADNDSLMEEIDLFLADDGSIPPGIESDDVDSVDDDTSISLPEFESFYVDYPNSGNSTIDVVEDIPVDVPNVLPTHPILEQDFIPTSEFFAYVVWIFLPFLAYPVIPPSLLSCGDEDTIFDPGISKDCPDCEDSQFCHSSRVSHPQLHLGIRYPNLID